MMDYNKELFELQEYCKASANFITDNDSIEDRYARQAYKDIANKIAVIFERALKMIERAEDCSTCEHQTVSKFVEPCHGCNDHSNYQIKTHLG